MVECEFYLTDSLFPLRIVLIDTWWNVNQAPLCLRNLWIFVLIDTWWNVNYLQKSKCRGDYICFNRYMVECEFYISGFEFRCT